MPRLLPTCVIATFALLAAAPIARAQDSPRLWIRNVTVDDWASTLTLTGSGFTDTCEVTLDGETLTVLPGASATQLVVVASQTVLATPGTYRLTVVDKARRAGDAFEMTVGTRAEHGPGTARGSDAGAQGAGATPLDPGIRSPRFAAAPADTPTTRITESPGSPYTAALGYQALFNNATPNNFFGERNTAIGYHALYNNSWGYRNTGVGFRALYGVVNGGYNTALGYEAGSEASQAQHTIYIGSGVRGVASEGNTLRLGQPYTGWPNYEGINRAFIAGIRGTTVTGATPVGVDANGQLGMADRLGAGAGYGCAGCYQNGTIELYNPATGDMTLQSGPAYRLLFNPGGGHVGVGVNSLLGAGLGFGCTFCYQSGFLELYNPATGNMTIQSGPAYDMLLNPNGGYVGVGLANAQYPLHLASGAHVTAGGVWTNASSRASKDHITPLTLDEAQDALVALAPVKYVYKADPSEPQIGFIAEDVPALVAQNDRASLSPMDLVAVLTKVVQAQQAQLAAQERELHATAVGHEAAIADLRAQLAVLQAQLARLGRVP